MARVELAGAEDDVQFRIGSQSVSIRVSPKLLNQGSMSCGEAAILEACTSTQCVPAAAESAQDRARALERAHARGGARRHHDERGCEGEERGFHVQVSLARNAPAGRPGCYRLRITVPDNFTFIESFTETRAPLGKPPAASRIVTPKVHAGALSEASASNLNKCRRPSRGYAALAVCNSDRRTVCGGSISTKRSAEYSPSNGHA